MEIKRVGLIGLGAMGVFFAPRLSETLGSGFFVIAEGARRERLQRDGVHVNGIAYRFPVETPEGDAAPADLLIMAVKDYSLAKAIQDIRRFVGEKTQIILCVMNGVSSEEQVAAVYGWEHVLYSYMRVSIEMIDGMASFNPVAGRVYFGEKSNDLAQPTERVAAIEAVFNRCGVPYRVLPDMLHGLWFKFLCNVGENLTCALLGVPFGAFTCSDAANAIRVAAMKEVQALAAKKGILLTDAEIEKQNGSYAAFPFQNRPSTLQDLERGRETEVELFAGYVVRESRAFGLEAPISWMFLQGIRVLEEKRQGKFS